jgi:DNA polymerase
MSEHDDHDELRSVVAGFRTHIAWRAQGGAFAAPAGPSPRREPLPVAPSRKALLQQVRDELGDCTRCKLHERRTNIVFGVGDPEAPLMFVGEGPGADEDRKGEPFVGKAGQLLDKMIAAMGWTRSAVFICNVVKCRPPGNRDPEPDEVEACEPFLFGQIDAIAPQVIVTLGRPAAHLLLRTTAPISRLRGRWQKARGVQVMPTFHPAYLLRSPDKKREAWSDLQQVMQRLDELGIVPPPGPPPGPPKAAP